MVGRYDGFLPLFYGSKDAFLALAKNDVLAELTKTLPKVIVIAHLHHELVLILGTLFHPLQRYVQIRLVLPHPTLQHPQHISSSRRELELFARGGDLQGETSAVFLVVFLVGDLRGEGYSIDHGD